MQNVVILQRTHSGKFRDAAVIYLHYCARLATSQLSSACSQMADNSIPDHVIDIDRHGGTEVLAGPIPPPKIGGNCALDENVVKGKYHILFLSSTAHCNVSCFPLPLTLA